MDFCRSCDKEWIAHNAKAIVPNTGFSTVWSPSCPNAISSFQQCSCPPVILELGPICPVTCELIAASMMDPEQVPAESRQFLAKFLFQRALENVLYIQAAVDIVVSIMKREHDKVFSLRLISCFDLLYIDRQNLGATEYSNVIYFLKQIYTVLKARKVRPESFDNQLSLLFLTSLSRWSLVCLESPLIESFSEMKTFLHVLRCTINDLEINLPNDTRKLKSLILSTISLGTLKKTVKHILWDILKLFSSDY